MATLNFKIAIHVENPDLLPEIQGRINDLRPAFEEIVKKWARNNKEKFLHSRGMESSGAEVDPATDVFWEALSPSYMTRKRKEGFADQIMVRTGELEFALEDPEGFFHAEMPQTAAFGVPKSFEDEQKAMYNFERRPTIFLSLTDQKMIEETLTHYFELGGDFRDILFSRGLENLKKSGDSAQMDIEFAGAVASE